MGLGDRFDVLVLVAYLEEVQVRSILLEEVGNGALGNGHDDAVVSTRTLWPALRCVRGGCRNS